MQVFGVTVVLLVQLLCIAQSVLPPPPASQIAALEDFYVSLNGSAWSWQYPISVYGNIWNFSGSNVNPCDNWQGLLCNNLTSSISSIRLSSNGIVGRIPDSFQQLTNLSMLYLHDTMISGTISSAFCQMPLLNNIYLGIGRLTGKIPACLTESKPLVFLSLHSNFLSGPLPPFSAMSAASITYFSVTNNKLTGSVPASYSMMNKLHGLFIAYNYLTGSTIDYVVNMTSLRQLSLVSNFLVATIPESISVLAELEYVYIGQNHISGTIPLGVCSSGSKMLYFSSYLSFLSGELPDCLQTWSSATLIALDGNLLTGTIPAIMIESWVSVAQLTLYDNQFSGTLSSAFATLSNIEILLLNNNLFHGHLDQAFDTSRQLQLNTIDISTNRFTGTISTNMFGANLVQFVAFYTCFEGSIPVEVCSSTKLEALSLDSLTSFCSEAVWSGIPGSPRQAPRISGTIPSCIWTDLANLTTLQISGNGLSGTIPSLSAYGNLSYLDLSYNSLNGTIPFVLQSLRTMEFLNLESNKFVGEVSGLGLLPYSQADQAVTTTLRLANNRLSGVIPTAVEYTRNIFIVEGNLFSCSFRHPLPSFDSDRDNAVCASDLLDISLWLFLSAGVSVAILIAFPIIVIARHITSIEELKSSIRTKYSKLTDFHLLREEQRQLLSTVSSSSPVPFQTQFKIAVLWFFIWNAQVNRILNSVSHESQAPSLVQFLRTLRRMRQLIVTLMLLIVSCGLSTFASLKTAFATVSIQYRWRFSGAFMSGVTPALTLLMLWAFLLGVTVCWIKYFIPREPKRIDNEEDRTWSGWRATNQSVTSTSSDSRYLQHVRQPSHQSQASCDSARSTLSSSSKSVFKDVSKSLGDSFKRGTHAALQKVQRKSMWLSIAVFIFNVIFILGLKAGFVYFLVGTRSSFSVKVFMEVCLSALDMGWTTIIVPFLIANFPNIKAKTSMMLKAIVLYFNSVIASGLVISITASTCFNGLFQPEPAVTEEFWFDFCSMYSPIDKQKCIDSSSYVTIYENVPVFYYNYNCYSTVIVEYVPVFLMSYSTLCLLIPLGAVWIIFQEKKSWFFDLVPGVYFLKIRSSMSAPKSPVTNESTDGCPIQSIAEKPQPLDVESATRMQVLMPQFISASTIHHLLVMLTFAVVSPVLAVAVTIATVIISVCWEVLIGRWTLQDEDWQQQCALHSAVSISLTRCPLSSSGTSVGPFTKKLDELCVGVSCGPTRFYSLLSFGSALFISFICLDIAGDSVGWKNGLWLFGVSFGFALCCSVFGIFTWKDVVDSSRYMSMRLSMPVNSDVDPPLVSTVNPLSSARVAGRSQDNVELKALNEM